MSGLECKSHVSRECVMSHVSESCLYVMSRVKESCLKELSHVSCKCVTSVCHVSYERVMWCVMLQIWCLLWHQITYINESEDIIHVTLHMRHVSQKTYIMSSDMMSSVSHVMCHVTYMMSSVSHVTPNHMYRLVLFHVRVTCKWVMSHVGHFSLFVGVWGSDLRGVLKEKTFFIWFWRERRKGVLLCGTFVNLRRRLRLDFRGVQMCHVSCEGVMSSNMTHVVEYKYHVDESRGWVKLFASAVQTCEVMRSLMSRVKKSCRIRMSFTSEVMWNFISHVDVDVKHEVYMSCLTWRSHVKYEGHVDESHELVSCWYQIWDFWSSVKSHVWCECSRLTWRSHMTWRSHV